MFRFNLALHCTIFLVLNVEKIISNVCFFNQSNTENNEIDIISSSPLIYKINNIINEKHLEELINNNFKMFKTKFDGLVGVTSFHELDVDSNGLLDLNELSYYEPLWVYDLMNNPTIKKFFMDLFDKNHDETISINEFNNIQQHKIQNIFNENGLNQTRNIKAFYNKTWLYASHVKSLKAILRDLSVFFKIPIELFMNSEPVEIIQVEQESYFPFNKEVNEYRLNGSHVQCCDYLIRSNCTKCRLFTALIPLVLPINGGSMIVTQMIDTKFICSLNGLWRGYYKLNNNIDFFQLNVTFNQIKRKICLLNASGIDEKTKRSFWFTGTINENMGIFYKKYMETHETNQTECIQDTVYTGLIDNRANINGIWSTSKFNGIFQMFHVKNRILIRKSSNDHKYGHERKEKLTNPIKIKLGDVIIINNYDNTLPIEKSIDELAAIENGYGLNSILIGTYKMAIFRFSIASNDHNQNRGFISWNKIYPLNNRTLLAFNQKNRRLYTDNQMKTKNHSKKTIESYLEYIKTKQCVYKMKERSIVTADSISEASEKAINLLIPLISKDVLRKLVKIALNQSKCTCFPIGIQPINKQN